MKSNNFGLISIIMAAYNAEKTIGFAIESVLNQTYKNFELVIVNDCSKDDTKAIIESYAEKDGRIKLISNKENSGVSLTRLEALKNCSGEWIAILDSDDAWVPDKLERQIELQQIKNADLVFTGVKYIDSKGNNIDWELKVPEQIGYKRLLKQNLITNSSALVTKALYSSHYSIGDSMHEDFAMWLSILKSGIIAYGIDDPLTIYRVSANSKSGNKLKSAVMNWKTYRFIGLNVFESAYYMIWYTVNGILKYKNLK